MRNCSRLILIAVATLGAASSMVSCQSPTGMGAGLGALTGAGAGYAYDRMQNDHPDNRHNRDTARRMAVGAGLGSAAGAGIGYMAGQAAQNQNQGYGAYPQQGYSYPQGQQPNYPGYQTYQQPPQGYGVQPAYYRQAAPPPPYGY